MSKVAAIIIAHNEAATIEKALTSLHSQTLKPKIIVVCDRSTDETLKIASRLADLVVNVRGGGGSFSGTPALARILNTGFRLARLIRPDYLLVCGADTILPPDYIRRIVDRMRSEKGVVVASGMSWGETTRNPRGSGRIIDARWFERIGFRYPENWGFESYVLFKALSMGYKVRVYEDVTFYLARGTSITPAKAYYWGAGMRALGYWWPYALARMIRAILTLRSVRVGVEMWRGYMRNGFRCYEDLSRFVREYQRVRVAKRAVDPLKGIKEFRSS